LLLAWELVIWTQRLTFAELWPDCASVLAVAVDVAEGEALAVGEAVAEREAVAEGDGVPDGECDADAWTFALGEALGLTVGEALLADLLRGLVASCVSFFALLSGDFDGVGFGVALLEALEALADGDGETEGVGEEDAEGEELGA
jgi:hypothetical protein